MFDVQFFEHRVVLSRENKINKLLTRLVLLGGLIFMNLIFFTNIPVLANAFLETLGVDNDGEFVFNLTKIWIGLQLLITVIFINFTESNNHSISINTYQKKINEQKDIFFWTNKADKSYDALTSVFLEDEGNYNYFGYVIVGKNKYLVAKDSNRIRIEENCKKLANKLNVNFLNGANKP